MQLRVPVPAVDGLLPEGSSLVIKSNPLYSGSQQGAVLNNSKVNYLATACKLQK